MKKKIVYYLLIVLCLFTFIYSSYQIYGDYKDDQKQELIAFEAAVPSTKKEKPEEIVSNVKSEYQNNDIVGTIRIPGTNINHAFVQTTNNTH